MTIYKLIEQTAKDPSIAFRCEVLFFGVAVNLRRTVGVFKINGVEAKFHLYVALLIDGAGIEGTVNNVALTHMIPAEMGQAVS